jgi:hypothetical protein
VDDIATAPGALSAEGIAFPVNQFPHAEFEFGVLFNVAFQGVVHEGHVLTTEDTEKPPLFLNIYLRTK